MKRLKPLFFETIGRWLMLLLLVMCSSLAAQATEAYTCYTPSDSTLTFYNDNQRSSRSGETYDLNRFIGDPHTSSSLPGWYDVSNSVTQVVFDPSFANVRPGTTHYWFCDMYKLKSITGMQYLNTSNVVDMSYMFCDCSGLMSLNVSGFNTAYVKSMECMFCNCSGLVSLDVSRFHTTRVTDMSYMFRGCSGLKTIFASDGWDSPYLSNSINMFLGCTNLEGGMGTTYDANHTDAAYAHLDGGPSNPGYFSEKGPEAYACYTSYSPTLTFYYDKMRDSRTGTTYDLNTGTNQPEWYSDGTYRNVEQVVFAPSFAGARPTTTYRWFYGMSNLQSITGMEYLNTVNVTTMRRMFADCTSLESLDVSNFNTSNVTDMYEMFAGCHSLESLDVSGFNTDKVITMHGMFLSCYGLTSLDVSAFNTLNVANMASMFLGCWGLESLDLKSFNTANVTSMGSMFSSCTGLTSLDVSSFNTANVTSMGSMFSSCTGLTSLDVSSFNTANVRNMSYMFNNCSGLMSLDLSSFNTSNVTSMSNMFNGCSGLESLDLSGFNTSNVKDMNGMFYDCDLESLDLSSFNTSNVIDMHLMFKNCSGLMTVYVGEGWNTAKVTVSWDMFYDCTSLVGGQGTTFDAAHVDKEYAHIDGGPDNPGYMSETPAEAYVVYTPNDSTLTFYYDNQRRFRLDTTFSMPTGREVPGWLTAGIMASSYQHVVFDPSFAACRPTSTRSWFESLPMRSVTGIEYLNMSQVTDMSRMFNTCRAMTSIDLSHFNTENVTNMDSLFYNCFRLTSIDLSSFNTSSVTSMKDMFYNCSSLTSIDLSHFNTSNVIYMNEMFMRCSGLTSLDLSNFNTSNVTKMYQMFNSCTNLSTIYVGDGWNTSSVNWSVRMFYNCTSLVGGQGTTFDSNHVDVAYAHIDGGPSNPGYFSEKPQAGEAQVLYDPETTTLTFTCGNQRGSRSGMAYDLNTGATLPEWVTDGTYRNVTRVVFEPSFAAASPTTTYYWFNGMANLVSVTGMEYLHTDCVTDMSLMFANCRNLTSLDLSHFNTSNVTSMESMFENCYGLRALDLSSFNTDNVTTMYCMFFSCIALTSVDLSSFTNARVTRTSNMFDGCPSLTTIYASSSWYLPANNDSWAMFMDCTSLVGGKGTTYDENHVDAEYAHIDGGPSNPGYFTEKPGFLRGDVDCDGGVGIADVTALIDYILNGYAPGVDATSADVDLDGGVSIGDITVLIDYILNGVWPS